MLMNSSNEFIFSLDKLLTITYKFYIFGPFPKSTMVLKS